MQVTRYKMRAEAPMDFNRAWRTLHMFTWNVVGGGDMGGPGDCEITFESKWTLAHIKRVLELIPDGHVMAETVALFEDYTGER